MMTLTCTIGNILRDLVSSGIPLCTLYPYISYDQPYKFLNFLSVWNYCIIMLSKHHQAVFIRMEVT